SMRFPVDLGQDAVDPVNGAGTVLSPDGTRLAYRARNTNGRIQLFARMLDSDQATPLAGTENAISPFFSPDGLSVGVFDIGAGKLKEPSLLHGNVVELCDIQDARGGSWDEDGSIIAGITARGPLYRIPPSGGTPQPITDLKQAVTHRWPQIIPGAHAV